VALRDYEVVGASTNLDLLRAIVAAPAFLAADLDTGFIGRHIQPEPATAEPDAVSLVAVALTLRDASRPGEAADPWDVADSFRVNLEGWREIQLRFGGTTRTVRAVPGPDSAWRLTFDGRSWVARAVPGGVSLDGVSHRVSVVRRGDELTAIREGRNAVFEAVDPLVPVGAKGTGDDRVVAPIPARVTQVLVAEGDVVTKGTPLIVLEAMKMEITLPAPRDGIIGAVRYAMGDMVEEGTDLVQFAESS